MNREEISEELKWNLDSFFKNRKEFDEAVSKAKEEVEFIKGLKGELCSNIEHYMAFMNHKESLDCLINNTYTYAQSLCDVEPNEAENQLLLSIATDLLTKVSEELNFANLELIEQQANVSEFLKDEDCKDFRYPMNDLFRYIPHYLDKASEELLASFEDIAANSAKIYQSLRLEFPDVLVDGKAEFLNAATLKNFLQSPNSSVREDAFIKYYSEYKRYDNAFCNMLVGNAKAQILEAKTRKYNSALEASLFYDGASIELFDKVLKMANKKYITYFHEYNALKKKILKLEPMHFYDLNIPLVGSVNKKYSIDESFEILKAALKPLGDDYVKMIDVARKDRWFDFMPHSGKRSGAYSSGTYDSNPVILMSFTGNYDALSTLAHEFGHSMHSYYSKENNRAMLSEYRIFVAEVASTVNEVLLNAYLIKNTDDVEYKKYLTYNFLEQLVGTIYRQPMFADFEAELHALLEKGEPVSSAILCDYYLNSSKNYFGKDVVVDELVKYQIYAVPHFYYNFYVYKYTLGMSVALSFAAKILKGDNEAYLAFLHKGGSEAPIDELINAGVDPCADSVYEDAFTYFKNLEKEFEDLMLNK